jgi:hypothetical protein
MPLTTPQHPYRWRGGPLRPRQTGQLLGPVRNPLRTRSPFVQDLGWMALGIIALLLIAAATSWPLMQEAGL